MKMAKVTAEELWEGNRRLDASYYASPGVEALHFIHQWSGPLVEPRSRRAGTVAEPGVRYSRRRTDSLAEVCVPGGVFIPGRFKRIFVDDTQHGAPYLTGGSILQADPLTGAKYLSYRYTANMDELALRERMILVTCSGTIGNSIYVNSNLIGAVGSPDLIRIIADPDRILPGYLYTFISSPLGRALIEQKTYGAVVPHIEAHHVMDLPIPRLDPSVEQRIHDLVERAAEYKTLATHLVSCAQESLLRTHDLPRLSNREALTKGLWCFSVPTSGYGRYALTAWTYNPIGQGIRARVKSKPGFALLQDLVVPSGISYGHQFKRIDADPRVGIELFSQSHVFQERPMGRWISRASVPDYSEYMVPDGATLVAAQGTMGDNELFGHCQFSHRNFYNRMITQHILRVIPDSKQVNPGYLFAFLSSEYGFQLFRSTACGTKLLGFILSLVAQIPIPLGSQETQDQIGGMVYQAYDYRADALLLEDKALALLDEALGAAVQYT